MDTTAEEVELAQRELARRRIEYFTKYNYPTYEVNWHHRVLMEKLDGVLNGTIKRLMVFMPPRHGKSELCSIQFPAFAIGKNQDKQIIQASYSGDLATDFGRQVRNLIQDTPFKMLFPDVELAEDSQAKGKWNTKGRGSYSAVGIGGSLTGRGADILIIDDPIKNREEAESQLIRDSHWAWYTSTARTRLMPGGAIIVVVTRWHDDDLAGRILANSTPGSWDVLEYPAIAEKDEEFRKVGEPLWATRYTLQELEDIRKDVGEYDFSSLYQQQPINAATQEFKSKYFKTVKEPPQGAQLFIAIDTAASQRDSADNTGIAKCYVDHTNQWFIAAEGRKMTPLQLIDYLFSVYAAERPVKIGIEKTIFLIAIKPFLDAEMRRRNVFLPIVELEHGNKRKEDRIRALLPRYEAGAITHIEHQCDMLVAEALRFPKGRHDDVLDATAYLTQLVKGTSGARVTGARQRRYGDIQSGDKSLIHRKKPFGYGGVKGYTQAHD